MVRFMKISRVIALAGSIVTLIQIFLIAGKHDGICLNDGCKVVDSLTTVDPIIINLGGFLFFQAVFWGLWVVRKDNSKQYLVHALLLAGLAAEGVLVSFQHYIAETFCSYCLIIFSLIFLLNIVAGIRHLVAGASVFIAVVLGFSSLQFGGGGDIFEKLDSGTYAKLGDAGEEKNFLFFSSSCHYCEEVIASLDGKSSCSVSFNPLDTIAVFPLKQVEISDEYRVSVNKKVLSALGIEQIPTLLIVQQGERRVLTGAGKIQQYLADQCIPELTATESESEKPIGQSSNVYSPAGGLDLLPPLDDGCSVATDCDPPSTTNP